MERTKWYECWGIYPALLCHLLAAFTDLGQETSVPFGFLNYRAVEELSV